MTTERNKTETLQRRIDAQAWKCARLDERIGELMAQRVAAEEKLSDLIKLGAE